MSETWHERRIDPLDRHTQFELQLDPLLERRETGFGRGEKEVPDLVEVRLAELLEEGDALAREVHLRGGRELLPHAAHCPEVEPPAISPRSHSTTSRAPPKAR